MLMKDLEEEGDPVHQAVQAEAEAVHALAVVAHQADHVAHVAEASHVVDVQNPNQNHQRVAVAPSQSKCQTNLSSVPLECHKIYIKEQIINKIDK